MRLDRHSTDTSSVKTRTLSLTAELVARCHRIVEDAGPDTDGAHLDDSDYTAFTDQILAGLESGEPIWLFAYGSLIWKPEVPHDDERVARVQGWHRSFCLRQTRWRGTVEQPGLMMGLEPGGACQGLALRLPHGDARAQIDKLLRREMTLKPSTYTPRWLKLKTAEGPLRGLGFVINRQGRAYAGPLSDAEVARTLADACGHWGSGADYLYNVVSNLERYGMHDSHLWRLQQLVAENIQAKS